MNGNKNSMVRDIELQKYAGDQQRQPAKTSAAARSPRPALSATQSPCGAQCLRPHDHKPIKKPGFRMMRRTDIDRARQPVPVSQGRRQNLDPPETEYEITVLRLTYAGIGLLLALPDAPGRVRKTATRFVVVGGFHRETVVNAD